MSRVGGRDIATVEKWVLDASSYQAELKKLASEIRASNRAARDAELVQRELAGAMGAGESAAKDAADAHDDLVSSVDKMSSSNKGMIRSWADVSAAIGTFTRSARAVGDAVGTLSERSGKLRGLQQAQTISIAEAQRATGGLIDKYTLLEAANRGVALGVDLSAEKFAGLAKASAIVAQRLGTDAPQAINDLMTGLGRQSAMILDNLGVIVKAEQAYDEYAATQGKTASALTATEKRIAFQTAALKELNRIAGEGRLETQDLGASWDRFKATLSDSLDLIAGGAGKIKTLAFAFEFWGDKIKDVAYWLTGTSARLQNILGQVNAARNQAFNFISADEIAKQQDAAMAAVVAKGQKKGRSAANDNAASGDGYDVSQYQPEFSQGSIGGLTRQDRVEQTEQLIRAQNAVAESEQRRIDIQERGIKVALASAKAQRAHADVLRSVGVSSAQMALGAVQQLAGGMFAAADAAIQAGAGFGGAMLQLTKATLLGVAQQAAVLAVFHLAAGWGALGTFLGLPNPGSKAHFTAAAIYGGVAAGAGAAGLAISAATAPSSGGTGASGGSGTGRNAAGAERQSFGTRKKESDRPIVVELYLGDRGNRAAALLARKQLKAQLAAA